VQNEKLPLWAEMYNDTPYRVGTRVQLHGNTDAGCATVEGLDGVSGTIVDICYFHREF